MRLGERAAARPKSAQKQLELGVRVREPVLLVAHHVESLVFDQRLTVRTLTPWADIGECAPHTWGWSAGVRWWPRGDVVRHGGGFGRSRKEARAAAETWLATHGVTMPGAWHGSHWSVIFGSPTRRTTDA